MKQNPFCINPIACNPKAILEDSIRITGFADFATITVDVNEDIAAVMVDCVQIQRVFMNLIITHSPRAATKCGSLSLVMLPVSSLKARAIPLLSL